MALASPTVYVAVDAALLADSQYMAVAVDRGVYATGSVPDNQRLSDGTGKNGYTEIGSSTETDNDQFDFDAANAALTLTVRATNKRWAMILSRHIERILHTRQIQTGVFTGESHWLVEGRIRFIEDFANPNGSHSAVLQYVTSTVYTG